MAILTKAHTFVDGTKPTAAQFNGDFDPIYNEVNGNLDNNNIKANAGISPSKIAGTAITRSATEEIENKTLLNPVIKGDVSGWTLAADTWVYLTPTSFRIVGADRTSIYRKGTRIKCVINSTTIYGVVIGSTFASGDTTITLAATPDHVLASGTITSAQYSYQLSPQGYPGWFNFVPVFTGFSADPAGGVKKFKIDGNTCTITVGGMTNGTSNATTTTLTVPVAPVSSIDFGGVVIVNDSGTFKSGYIAITPSVTLSMYTAFSQIAWGATGNKNFYIPPTSFEF